MWTLVVVGMPLLLSQSCSVLLFLFPDLLLESCGALCQRVHLCFISDMDVRQLLGPNISSALQDTLSAAETIALPIDIYDF